MIKSEEIENLANLARLELGVEERAKLAGDLERILAYVSQLGEAKAKPVDADIDDYLNHNIWRADENPSATKSVGDFVRVKKIF